MYILGELDRRQKSNKLSTLLNFPPLVLGGLMESTPDFWPNAAVTTDVPILVRMHPTQNCSKQYSLIYYSLHTVCPPLKYR